MPRSRPPVPTLLAFFVLFVLAAAVAWSFWGYSYDDAFITYRYARRRAPGIGGHDLPAGRRPARRRPRPRPVGPGAALPLAVRRGGAPPDLRLPSLSVRGVRDDPPQHHGRQAVGARRGARLLHPGG